ncbi:glucosidase 2 subunit beta-like [Centruroides vittatus]|uniref:glucosidase 2 subunit beta-like n=1 Tax=Centruroides vittatus TaxID=120091 RepID=UPI00350EA55F
MSVIKSLKNLYILEISVLTAVLLNISSNCDATVVLRPRGVPLSKKAFYDASKDFNCLDGSGTISFHYINDDYCDCADGSDEPGTAACPNGIFHCTNAGYIPKDIPSSRVNDGICDCCDASDEYNSTAECLNTCKELGNKAKEVAKRQQDAYLKGYQLRAELTKQGKQKKEEFKVRLEELKKEQEKMQRLRDEKEVVKKEMEEKEKAVLDTIEKEKQEKEKEKEKEEELKGEQEERVSATQAFQELDVNNDGKVTYQELQQFSKFDYNHDGTVSEEEAKFFLHMKEEMNLEEFITTGWMIMKPIYKYLMDEITEETPSEETAAPEPVDGGDKDKSQEEREVEEPDSMDDEPLEGDEDEEDDEDLEPMEFPPKEDLPAPEEKASKPMYSEEVQQIIDASKQAKQEFEEADRNLQRIIDDIRDVEQSLECDYGPEEEFAVLKGQCFEYHDREYVYKFCPFDVATQEPKSGGSSVTLGKWSKWEGLENNKYSVMKFEGGAVCWNGPARSVVVKVYCGIENKLFSATEPSRCEYQYEFETPALCSTPPAFESIHKDIHTEL